MTLRLQTATDLWGAAHIHDADPFVRERQDVYATPFIDNGHWGVFDSEDKIVPSTIDWWLPEQLPMRQIHESTFSYNSVADKLSIHEDYIYAGRYVNHFGHFLTETLSRLWFLADEPLGRRKLLIHGPGIPLDWWRNEYVQTVFDALKLTPDNFVHVSKPVRIHRLTIPRPSFGTQDFAHRAFTRLCHLIGKNMIGAWRPRRNFTPVYLSKSRLQHGVRRLRNEQLIVDVMEANGVDIVYPETLPLIDKVKLMATRSVISGTVMSGHHISILVPESSRFELISPAEKLNSNFFIIDGLNANRASYYYPEGVFESEVDSPTFIVDHALRDPELVARELLRRL